MDKRYFKDIIFSVVKSINSKGYQKKDNK